MPAGSHCLTSNISKSLGFNRAFVFFYMCWGEFIWLTSFQPFQDECFISIFIHAVIVFASLFSRCFQFLRLGALVFLGGFHALHSKFMRSFFFFFFLISAAAAELHSLMTCPRCASSQEVLTKYNLAGTDTFWEILWIKIIFSSSSEVKTLSQCLIV